MKYFLAQSIMLDPLPVPAEDMPSKYLPLHEKHLAEGIESGMVLFAGPKTQEGGVLFIALCSSIVNLLVDLLYAYIDPRIKAQYSKKKVKKPAAAQKAKGVA